MKAKVSFRTFSLRTLLLGSTLAAIGFAFVGNRMIENRRQERLLDEALKATVAEGANELSVGSDDGAVQLALQGESLSGATARRLIEAKRIRWIQIWGSQDVSPTVSAILATEFILDEPFPSVGAWRRKGCETRAAKREAWTLFQNQFYDQNRQVKQGSSP